MYNYHDSDRRNERLGKKLDRCAVDHAGRVFAPSPSDVDDDRLVDGCAEGNGPADGMYIYAVDSDGSLRMARDGHRPDPDAVKHETLFHNANVAAAGELVFAGGALVDATDNSGSYWTLGELETRPDFARALLDAITFAGVPIVPQLLARLRELAR
jgi:hypothetical protein